MDANAKRKLPKRAPEAWKPDAEEDTILDAADLGTAWGLDYSYEQAEYDGLPSGPRHDDADD